MAFFWKICVLISAAVSIVLVLRIILRMRSAPIRLKRVHASEGAAAAFSWVMRNHLGPFDPPISNSELAGPSAAVFICSLLICFLVVPWTPSGSIGQVLRVLVYLATALCAVILARVGLDRTAKKERLKLDRIIAGDPDYKDLRESLERVRETECETHITKMLATEVEAEQAAAARALQRVCDLALPRLLELLQASDPTKKMKIARALGLLGDQRAIEPLLTVAQLGDNFRLECGTAVARLGDGRGIQLLLSLVTNSDASMRDRAFENLNLIPEWFTHPKAKDAVPTLVMALTSLDPALQLKVVDVLDRIDQNWHQGEGSGDAALFLAMILRGKPLDEPTRPLWETLKKINSQLATAVVMESLSLSKEITTEDAMNHLRASILASFAAIRVKFVQLLAEIVPAIEHPLKLKDTAERVNDANVLEKAKQFLQQKNYEDAEETLLSALPRAPIKSEILGLLGNISERKEDPVKATAYHLLAVYAMTKSSRALDSVIYLRDLYAAGGNQERAQNCSDAAVAVGGGALIELASERQQTLEKAVALHPILNDIANHAWPSITDNVSSLAGTLQKESPKAAAAAANADSASTIETSVPEEVAVLETDAADRQSEQTEKRPQTAFKRITGRTLFYRCPKCNVLLRKRSVEGIEDAVGFTSCSMCSASFSYADVYYKGLYDVAEVEGKCPHCAAVLRGPADDLLGKTCPSCGTLLPSSAD